MKTRFLGPVCWYDMVRSARRGRYFLLRCLYALGLVCILCLMYLESFDLFDRQVRPQRLTQFGERYFSWFMIIQFLLSQLLTPAYVAGAIAEEKERKTLEFLLATDLQGQEIVFSKLISRLGNLILFLLAGLPVLSLVQLFGGVSPTLLWCGFGATGMAILSAACLSILVSVYVRRAREAIVWSTMLLFGYFLFGLLYWWLYGVTQADVVMGGKLAYADMSLGQKAYSWSLEVLLSGHIVYVLVRLFGAPDFSGLGMSNQPIDLLRNFALFHGAFACLFLGWACLRLRQVFVKQNYGTPLQSRQGRQGWLSRRPPVGDYPVLWKERHVEAAARMTKGAVFFYVLCVLFTFAPLGFIGYYALFSQPSYQTGQEELREAMNLYVRVAGTLVALLMLLGIGVRAASAVGSERDRQTLDPLLSSPLTLREILAGKWFGALFGAKRMFLLLATVWALGILSGGLHVAAPLVLLTALAAYSAFMASMGLYFGVTAKSTNRAMLWTVGLAIFWGGGFWICCGVGAMLLVRAEGMGYFLVGMTPPAVLFLSGFGWSDRGFNFDRDSTVWITVFSVLGVSVAAGLALLLWNAARQRFLAVSGRVSPGYWPRQNALAQTPEESEG